MDPISWPLDVPSASLGSAVMAFVGAAALWLRSAASKGQAEAGAIASVVERCKALEARVGVLEAALSAAQRERDEALTGKHEALGREREARDRLELVEREAARRIAEALAAVDRSARERASWERMARQQAAAYERLVDEINSGHSQAAPADRMDELDTLPPPRGDD